MIRRRLPPPRLLAFAGSLLLAGCPSMRALPGEAVARPPDVAAADGRNVPAPTAPPALATSVANGPDATAAFPARAIARTYAQRPPGPPARRPGAASRPLVRARTRPQAWRPGQVPAARTERPATIASTPSAQSDPTSDAGLVVVSPTTPPTADDTAGSRAAIASMAGPSPTTTPARPVPAAGTGAEHMWMKAQQLWLAARGGIVIGIVLLLALLLLGWLLRRRRRVRDDAPLRVLFPAHALPPRPRGETRAIEIPDWLRAQDATPAAPVPDVARPSMALPAAPSAPVDSTGPATAPAPASSPAASPAAPPPAAALPGWKTDPGKGAAPLNLRGPASAALTINGAPLVVPLPAAARDTASPPERPDAAFTRARALLGQDRPSDALALLAPLLGPGASAETWAVAGWCHWKLANETGLAQAAADAAQSFSRAIAADPARALPLARMIGRCHLLQAATAAPGRRAANVADAVRVFEAHFVGAPRLSPAALSEWAEALLEMARLAAPAQQPMWLGRLDAVAAAAGDDSALAPRWHRLRAAAAALRARHAATPAEHARLLRTASAELQAGSELLEDPHEREQWLAEWIDAERQPLAHGSTAARIAGYQALERRMQDMLGTVGTAAPLLAWVRVLADWAGLLDGPAARQRLAKTSAWFDRIDGLGDLDAGDRAFTRAYYLRLRAAHEHGATRARTLDEAARLLAALAPAEQARDPAVAMEQAQIALARAGAGDHHRATAQYREAIAHASVAADHPQTRLPGFRTLLCALLDWQRLAPETARLAQISVVAQWLRDEEQPPSPASLRLLARAALAGGDAAGAAELSAKAWQAGIDDHDILACWQQADAQWARELAQDNDRAAWQRQHRLLRLASSTT